jgi:hypothetical protein
MPGLEIGNCRTVQSLARILMLAGLLPRPKNHAIGRS